MNGDDMAFPMLDRNATPNGTYQPGLTKREMFAAMAMQGILANRVYDPPRRKKVDGMAEDAIGAADALIAALTVEGSQ